VDKTLGDHSAQMTFSKNHHAFDRLALVSGQEIEAEKKLAKL
jgi:hypothetical protein